MRRGCPASDVDVIVVPPQKSLVVEVQAAGSGSANGRPLGTPREGP